VRNCWSVAIAGYQGNAPSNISREGPTGAEGAGETAGPGRAAHGHTALPHGRARCPENPRAHKQPPARAQQHVVSYNPNIHHIGILDRVRPHLDSLTGMSPENLSRLQLVHARASAPSPGKPSR